MIYTALIGNPTEHSVSPILFEWLSKNTKNASEYRHIKINVLSESELEHSFEALKTLHFSGINVTLPYKLAVSQFLTYTDTSAKEIGAINTVVFKENEVLGYNTDWYGIYAPIKQRLPNFSPKKAVILGSGGAARAAIYACLKLEAEVVVVIHRTPNSSATASLKAQYKNADGVQFASYDDIIEHISSAELIINATPAGMKHQVTTPFDLKILGDEIRFEDQVFFDCVFNPVHTPLLDYFTDRGATTIDGLWMMLYQGLQAFALWTGRGEEVTLTQDALSELHKLLEKEVSLEH